MINTPASFVKLYCIFVGTNQNKKIMSDFGIQQALNELGLQDITTELLPVLLIFLTENLLKVILL